MKTNLRKNPPQTFAKMTICGFSLYHEVHRAERAIKELVIGRKNWLFSKSEKGAQATGIILSILRTAIENGLDPRKYLIYLFEKIPNLPSFTKNALAAYLPWDQEVQRKYRANY